MHYGIQIYNINMLANKCNSPDSAYFRPVFDTSVSNVVNTYIFYYNAIRSTLIKSKYIPIKI